MKRTTAERFQVALVAGKWEELFHRDSKRGYRQRVSMSAMVNVRVVRLFSRDRDGHKVETVQQFITGEPDAITSYLFTFPPIRLNVSSMIDHSGIMVQTQY